MTQALAKPAEQRILIVDDNRAIHDDIRKILAADEESDLLDTMEAMLFEGEPTPAVPIRYRLDSAFQGHEGLRKVEEAVRAGEPYAMAFIDMRMPPGWDGLETIERLWQVDPQLQVVICTAYSDYPWAEVLKRVGHADNLLILKKPFDAAEVAQFAAALTEKRRTTEIAMRKMQQLEGLIELGSLKLKRARLESAQLLSAISCILVGINAEGVVERWNPYAEQVLDLPARQAQGQRFLSLPIDWVNKAHVEQVFSPDSTDHQQRIELEFRDSAGKTRVLGLSVYPVLDRAVRHGCLVLGTELTDHRTMEANLRQAQKLEAVGQLAAGIAHEINTPLQYVGDNLQYLQSAFTKVLPLAAYWAEGEQASTEPASAEPPSLSAKDAIELVDEIPAALSDALDGVQHVSRIVRAMKEFSHPGSDEKAPIDINRALETTITVTRNEWKYVSEVCFTPQADLPLVEGLPGELNQVFMNLIVNAAHAIGDANNNGMDGMGKIDISTCRNGDKIVIAIQDSGSGIPKECRERVFEPFFTTKEVGKGTGQGLAIAYSIIVQKHGGRLWFETSEGEGTTFFIELPIDQPEPKECDTANLIETI